MAARSTPIGDQRRPDLAPSTARRCRQPLQACPGQHRLAVLGPRTPAKPSSPYPDSGAGGSTPGRPHARRVVGLPVLARTFGPARRQSARHGGDIVRPVVPVEPGDSNSVWSNVVPVMLSTIAMRRGCGSSPGASTVRGISAFPPRRRLSRPGRARMLRRTLFGLLGPSSVPRNCTMPSADDRDAVRSLELGAVEQIAHRRSTRSRRRDRLSQAPTRAPSCSSKNA